MSSEGLFGRAVHGVRWIGLSKAISQGFMWVVTIYVMRLLQPADYGVAAMGGVLTVLASMLLDAGLGAAFVQRRDVSDAVYRSANSALLASALFAVLIVQLLAAPAAHFFSEPVLEPILRVSSLQFLFGALAVVPSAILTIQMRFKELGQVQIISGVGSSFITLLLAWMGAGVWSLIVGVLAASFLRLIAVQYFKGTFLGFSTRASLLRSYMAFSGHLVVQRLLWFWVEQVDQMIVGRILGAVPLGVYSVARNLSHIPLDRTAEIVNQVSLPSFAAVQNDTQRWHDALRKLIRLASTVSFPIFWGMAATAPTALPLLLSAKWSEAVLPFMIFCVMLPLRTAHSLTGTVLLALGRADLSLKSVVVWAATLSPLFLVGAKFGLIGIATVWAVGFPLVYVATVAITARAMRMPASILFAPMAVPALAAFLSAASAFGAQWIFKLMLGPVALVVTQVLIGGVVYVAALRVISPRSFHETTDLVRRLLGGKSAS